MNAKDTIKQLRTIADHWQRAANHPRHYNSEGSHYLALAAQSLYQECDHLQIICDRFGMPQLMDAEVEV